VAHYGPHRCGQRSSMFIIEQLTDDLYAWSQGGDASLETKDSLMERIANLNGEPSGSELGGRAVGTD
jgi:hypothetical protein